ncbi:epoxide hydrolase family protein [Mumia sp. DW29H23]|uniref:epoxide hydrolase family protein n=1 Tax=Mumia sp. DW29H23 TaxID=3421241 RepID=UPI003D69988E
MIERSSPVVPDHALDTLRERLRATRWPEPATDPRQGIDLGTLQDLCAYWADGYDWRRCESRLDGIGRFRATVDGLGIDFLHARSEDPGAFPILLTHGWPGSVVEYLDVLGPLTEAGFHCVVPSLPGYGWSDKPTEPGWGVERIARAWAHLMARLGYDRYGAQGTDWGTSVTASLGQQDAAHIAGILLMPPLAPPLPGPQATGDGGTGDGATGELTDPDDASGYSLEQRTRPQTIGYSLTDSPAGLAAWILEKLDAWTDPRSTLGRDAVLDNLMHYWLPATGASAARLYWESLADVSRWLGGPLLPRDRVHVPTGCCLYPYELQQPTRGAAAQRFTDIRSWREPERGGHFPAWEQPESFVTEVCAFFDLVR